MKIILWVDHVSSWFRYKGCFEMICNTESSWKILKAISFLLTLIADRNLENTFFWIKSFIVDDYVDISTPPLGREIF